MQKNVEYVLNNNRFKISLCSFSSTKTGGKISVRCIKPVPSHTTVSVYDQHR